MKTGYSFRLAAIITLLISTAVLVLFSSKLYKAEKVKYEKTVTETMSAANYQETIIRFQGLGAAGSLAVPGLQLSYMGGGTSGDGSTPAAFIYKRFIPDTSANAQSTPKNDFDRIFEQQKQVTDVKSALAAGINAALRGTADMNLRIFDSLMVAKLKEKDIETPHSISLVYRDSVDKVQSISSPDFKEPKIFSCFTTELNLDSEGSAKYIYKSAPFKFLIKSISAVILLAVLALIIILLSLITLLKAISTLKQTEEIQNEFTHMVSHNMKNPLAIIKASADSLKSHLDSGDEKSKHMTDIIASQVIRLSDQIDSILRPCRINEGGSVSRLDEIDACREIQEMVNQFALTYPQVRFETHLESGAAIMADREMFLKMLENILQNAVKYSPDDPHIEVSCLRQNGGTAISVQDNGIGISQKDLTHLFDRYYKVEKFSSSAGYGLGLYFVKQVADLHHWGISVESEPGCGSTFRIDIP